METQRPSWQRIGGGFAWFLVTLAMLFYLYDFFLRVSPSVMVPELRQTYHIHALQLGNMSAFYYYIYTFMQIPVGILFDRYSAKWLMVFAVFVCALGALIFGASHHLGLAMFARLLMGLGSAFAFVGILKVATKWLPPERIALVSGLATALGMLGAIAGDEILMWIVQTFDWRWSMYVSAIAGGVLLLLFIVFFRAAPQHIQIKHQNTLMPVLKDLGRAVLRFQLWLNGAISFLMFIPISAFASLWAIPYLREAHHFQPFQATTVNAMLFLGLAFGAPVMGWLSDRIKRRKILIYLGCLCGCVLMTVVIYLPTLTPFLAGVLFFLIGLTVGPQTLTFPIARELSPIAIAATAFAFTNLICTLGGTIFQPVIGGLLDLNWAGIFDLHHLRHYNHQNFKIALSVLPIAYIAAFLLTFLLKETHCQLLDKES
jgi:MFS family permease